MSNVRKSKFQSLCNLNVGKSLGSAVNMTKDRRLENIYLSGEIRG